MKKTLTLAAEINSSICRRLLRCSAFVHWLLLFGRKPMRLICHEYVNGIDICGHVAIEIAGLCASPVATRMAYVLGEARAPVACCAL